MSKCTLASFVLAAIAVTSPLAFAANDQPSSVGQSKAYSNTSASSLTREQVSKETLAARRDGTLQPAGEGADPLRLPATSTVSSAYMRFDAKSARARGELRPAGEAHEPLNVRTTGLGKTRAEVMQETLGARLNGTLQPAGEGR